MYKCFNEEILIRERIRGSRGVWVETGCQSSPLLPGFVYRAICLCTCLLDRLAARGFFVHKSYLTVSFAPALLTLLKPLV